RDETVQSTITVALMVVVMSILLWCVDSLLMVIVGLFTG
ncbi:MAG: preprotein translocase subunit SecE, partial [Coxiellaceae bacterium]|nr:preprotein translocase subunit SecE [Coxiellaceae bacterium]